MSTPRRSDPALGGILATDQYQLTMAQLYWKEGWSERTAQFDYFFRSYPDYGDHQAGYCIAAGLGWLLEWMEGARFTRDDLEILAAQRTVTGEPRFDPEFITWLEKYGDFTSLEIRAIPEGRVVHPNAPIASVVGPLALAQILETHLLNRLNYPTLIATKASRAKEAARGGAVLEFGLRRGPEQGAHAGGYGALIGGADFTSNTALSTVMGLDPKGTHAHSMVQAYMALGKGELEAFRRFAELFPDECVLLVDTVDVLTSGVPNAITVFRELKEKGYQPGGIRLDSGDLAYLAIQSAVMLNDAGFPEVPIVLSSDLDELVIWQILSQIDSEAPRYGVDPQKLAARLVYGVGTRLITSEGDGALGGVYKLVALADDDGEMVPAIKVSEDVAKVPIPGVKRVFRVYDRRGLATADLVALADEDPASMPQLQLHHPHLGLQRVLAASEVSEIEELMVTVFSGGRRLDGSPDLEELRRRRDADLKRLDTGVRRLVNPHVYHVSVTRAMHEMQKGLLDEALDGADI
jgi:nicotinate phosphoribosyltransferase